MKCRLKDAFIIVLVIVFSITVEGEKYQVNSFQNNYISPKRISSNKYKSLESFPDLDYLDIKHHKIVKKQMGISDEINPISPVIKNENNMIKVKKKVSKPNDTNKEKKYKDDEDLSNFMSNCALYLSRRLRKKRALGIITKIFQGLKGINVQTYKPFQKKRTKKDIHNSNGKKWEDCNYDVEVPSNKDLKDYEGQPCKQFFRLPDKCDCHAFYECEAQPDGCMKIRHKKCKDDEMFSATYSECLNPAFLKVMRKTKREETAQKKKIKIPETPQDDSEPANEWLDASQEVAQKIPSEFKPKPKLKLKIYHLRCKKKAGKNPMRREIAKHNVPKVAKTRVQQKIFFDQDHKSSLHRIHKHPRSFLIRTNRREDYTNDKSDKESTNLVDNDFEEEDYEDYDDEEEFEDDADEDYEKERKKETAQDKRRRQEKLKELFKTGKGTIKSKVKYNEEPSSMIRTLDNFKNLEKKYTTEDSESFENRNSAKILIDADIKVDGEITDALSNILERNKEKSNNNVKNSVPEYLNDNP